MKKTPIHALTISVVILVFAWLMIERAQADSLFNDPIFFDSEPTKSDTTSIWKGDGSLVIIKGADEAGYVIKGDDSGNEIEYFVKPKSDGSPTFIYDNELIICTASGGCY
tara:strand:+ start:39 stop:368 length:330 start_codon:yes stop_codon:yes gene_type:complete